MDIAEIAEGVYSIGQKQGGYVHAFAFEHGKELTLVDTLWDHDGRDLLEFLRRSGHRPTDVKHIALTHGHRSHLGGLAALKRITGATVYAHEWEADIVAGERVAQPVPLRPLWPREIYKFRLGLALGAFPHRPCVVDNTVTDGAPVGPLEVVHTPGHSPGHLSFYHAEKRVLVAGDAIATWPSLDRGWPGFNLSEPRHAESVRQLAERKVVAVGVGHGDPITELAQERLASVAYL